MALQIFSWKETFKPEANLSMSIYLEYFFTVNGNNFDHVDKITLRNRIVQMNLNYSEVVYFTKFTSPRLLQLPRPPDPQQS
jgi:hypothetical protein